MMNFRFTIVLFSLTLLVLTGCKTKQREVKDWKEQEKNAERYKKQLPALEKIVSLQMGLAAKEMLLSSKESDEKKREQLERAAIQTARKINAPISNVLQYIREVQGKMRWIERQDSPPVANSDEARKLGKQAVAVAYNEIEGLKDVESLSEVTKVLRAQSLALRDQRSKLGELQKSHQVKHLSPSQISRDPIDENLN